MMWANEAVPETVHGICMVMSSIIGQNMAPTKFSMSISSIYLIQSGGTTLVFGGGLGGQQFVRLVILEFGHFIV